MIDDNVVRISRRVIPWFEAAFRSQALGERVAWEAPFAAARTTDGQMAPVFMVYAEIPAAQLGRVHTVFGSVAAVGITEPVVEQAVAGVLAQLHEMRRNELIVVSAGNGR